MVRLLNVAVPLTAVTLVVPDKVACAGLATISMSMRLRADVTVLPLASRTTTTIAGAIDTPATAVAGWTANPNWLATAGAVVSSHAMVNPVSANPLTAKQNADANGALIGPPGRAPKANVA